ncbi:MAG: hypothetical protein QGG74_03535 [Phycisphaerales bacterium]|jgi:hypothetical protein|nr:hypothetical protein [Phycisphaerales bacterium]
MPYAFLTVVDPQTLRMFGQSALSSMLQQDNPIVVPLGAEYRPVAA